MNTSVTTKNKLNVKVWIVVRKLRGGGGGGMGRVYFDLSYIVIFRGGLAMDIFDNFRKLHQIAKVCKVSWYGIIRGSQLPPPLRILINSFSYNETL